jgi:short subunit dehydrogenase-like uncharacterized protein
VVNCAGPFAESAPALIDAAARAEVHYIDVTGEIVVALETFEKYKERFRDASHVGATSATSSSRCCSSGLASDSPS